MLHNRLSAALLGAGLFAAAPAMASGDAQAGIKAMGEYNVIVLGDWTVSSHVQGKALIGGNASGSNAVIGQGGAQGYLHGDAPILTVGGSNSIGGLTVENKIGNAKRSVVIGGSSNGFNLNDSGAIELFVGGNFGPGNNVNLGNGDIVSVGGNFGVDGTVQSGGTLRYGSKTGTVNAAGGAIVQDLANGHNAADITARTAVIGTVSQDVKALSTALSGLSIAANPSSYSLEGVLSNKLVLHASDLGGANGYALINLAGIDWNNITQMSYDFASSDLPVIVNVAGTAPITLKFNSIEGANASSNRQVIWNFFETSEVNFTGDQFHGSVLAPLAKVTLNNNIEGSVVAGSFIQKGQVHLGTYGKGDDFLTPPVPEPASWAMLIMGFGLVGMTLRRRTTRVSFA